MQRSNSLQGKVRNLVFVFTALLVLAADQLSKIWIRSHLALGESVPETGFFQLTHVPNTGAVFGLFQGQSSALIAIALIDVIVLLLFVLFIYRRFPVLDNSLSRIALGLILGGTVGNLIDRLRLGHVTDFIEVGIWPTFNIADSAMVVGVAMFAYYLLRLTQVEKR